MEKINVKSHLKKILIVLLSIVPMALGICCYIIGNVGTDPFSVMVDGVAKLANIPFGTSSLICNSVLVVLFLIFYRKYVKLGTVLTAVLTGPLVNVLLPYFYRFIPPIENFFLGLLVCIVGAILIAIAVAFYLPCDYGASPIDNTVLACCDLIKKSYKWGYYIMYAVFLIIGIILGGVWGVGTIVGTFLSGPIIDYLLVKWDKPIKKFVA